MTKLAKYLKPFTFSLILAIALLFARAVCDLNLPNYMSEIVNVGIQQNGMEHAAPDAISESGMRLMTTFMDESQQKLVSESYSLVLLSDLNAAGQSYGSLYPNASGSIYVKNSLDSGTSAELDHDFGVATWTMINTMRSLSAQIGPSGTGSSSSDLTDLDITAVYQYLPMLEKLPNSSIESAREAAASNDESILNQSGIMMAKAFYTELGANTSNIATSYIFRIGLIMLAFALLGGAATIMVSLLSSRIAAGVAKNLRSDVFEKIERFSSNEFDRFSTASLITRCTNDVTQIQQLLMMGIRMICYAPIMAIGGIIMAVNKSVSMSWIIAVACIVLIGVIMIVMTIAMPKFKAIQKLVDKLNLVSRENLTGMMVIRAFGTQRHEEGRFEAANRDLTSTSLFINRVMVFMMPMMMLIMNGSTLLIVWVGAHQIANATIQIGDMMAFMQYAMQIIMAFLMISMTFIFVPRAAVSATRISEVLETKESISDPLTPQAFDPSQHGIVEFRHVHFRYQGAEEDALDDVTFTAYPGQTTAIIGSTGSGKTTITSLLLRFYDVSSGSILIDGTDIRQVRQCDLRNQIGYVPQKGILLSGTVASNIRYGSRDPSDAETQAAAQVAQAMEFISQMPEHFESPIAQGGTNVSGGQKQRLSIARALAKKPEIFVFDDSFSALDFRTDVALRKALKETTGSSTVIIVAQRVSTIRSAEQIIVLDEGRIVGRGTHEELMKNCPEYYEIASSQLSQEELS